MAINKKAIVETVKSAGRFVYFGLLGLIAAALGALILSPDIVTATVTIHGVNISVGGIIVTVVGIITKGIDTYIHNNDKLDSNGIAPTFLQK